MTTTVLRVWVVAQVSGVLLALGSAVIFDLTGSEDASNALRYLALVSVCVSAGALVVLVFKDDPAR
jgi:hypothetical protein